MDTERLKEAFLVEFQERRGFDKYILAPFLIYVGVKSKKIPKWQRRVLVTAGIYQFFYAWNDYMRLQENLKRIIGNKGA